MTKKLCPGCSGNMNEAGDAAWDAALYRIEEQGNGHVPVKYVVRTIPDNLLVKALPTRGEAEALIHGLEEDAETGWRDLLS